MKLRRELSHKRRYYINAFEVQVIKLLLQAGMFYVRDAWEAYLW